MPLNDFTIGTNHLCDECSIQRKDLMKYHHHGCPSWCSECRNRCFPHTYIQKEFTPFCVGCHWFVLTPTGRVYHQYTGFGEHPKTNWQLSGQDIYHIRQDREQVDSKHGKDIIESFLNWYEKEDLTKHQHFLFQHEEYQRWFIQTPSGEWYGKYYGESTGSYPHPLQKWTKLKQNHSPSLSTYFNEKVEMTSQVGTTIWNSFTENI